MIGKSKQRFHKHRVGSMVVPGVSGLLFSIDPMRLPQARRELERYFQQFAPETDGTKTAKEVDHAVEFAASGGVSRCESTSSLSDADNISDMKQSESSMVVNRASSMGRVPTKSVSALLAQELSSTEGSLAHGLAAAQNEPPETELTTTESSDNADDLCNYFLKGSVGRRTKRPRDDAAGVVNAAGDNESEREACGAVLVSEREPYVVTAAAHARKPRTAKRARWFSELESGCKGYLFFNVPCDTADSDSQLPASEVSPTGAVGSTTPLEHSDGALSRERFRVNERVCRLVEDLFEDFRRNPRPLFRFTFRLFPAPVTCLPTPSSILEAVTKLKQLYFPPAQQAVSVDAANAPSTTFVSPIPPRFLHRISICMVVKNNTTVERERVKIIAQIEQSFPSNRFVLFPYPRVKQQTQQAASSATAGSAESTQRKDAVEIDALVSIFVAHSTCMVGVMPQYSLRQGYNFHAMGKEHLDLFSPRD